MAVDHERGGSVVPTFVDVGTPCFLAHRRKLEPAHDRFEPAVVVTEAHLDPHPLGLALAQIQTLVHAGFCQPTPKTNGGLTVGPSGRDTRAAAPREHAEVLGPHSPRNIRTRHRRATP